MFVWCFDDLANWTYCVFFWFIKFWFKFYNI
jgi:hypothetical protein